VVRQVFQDLAATILVRPATLAHLDLVVQAVLASPVRVAFQDTLESQASVATTPAQADLAGCPASQARRENQAPLGRLVRQELAPPGLVGPQELQASQVLVVSPATMLDRQAHQGLQVFPGLPPVKVGRQARVEYPGFLGLADFQELPVSRVQADSRERRAHQAQAERAGHLVNQASVAIQGLLVKVDSLDSQETSRVRVGFLAHLGLRARVDTQVFQAQREL